MFDAQVYLSALCRVVPHHVVEQVLVDPTARAVGQQRFEGTVMVADLVGFTALCQRLTLQGRGGLSRLSSLLDRLFERLELEAIFPFRGYIVQFAGDALVAVFRDNDHRLRAVASALEIQRQVTQLAGDPLLEGPLLLRIGVAAGETYLNVFGDMTQRIAVCAGPAVHRALELQSGAQPGELALDQGLIFALGSELVRQQGQPWDLKRWPEREQLDQTYYEQHFTDRVDEKIRLLESFLPAPLARRIRGTPHGWRLRGEVRRAVVQFIDLEGFSERPELFEVAVNLSRSLLRGFRKYDGVVLKASTIKRGHRIMVLYGLSRPAEHDAERAVLAALEGQARLKAFAAAHREHPLSIRSGTHIGELYLGSVGSWYRHDVTAIGDAVNLAARVTQGAAPFENLVTDPVAHRLEEQYSLHHRDPAPVRGRSGETGLHLVHGPKDQRAHYVQRRSAPRFQAGRAAQVQRLEEIIDQALTGRARVLGIVGDAGTGKSHLLATLIDRWIERGGVGMVGRCRYATRSLPLAPVVGMLSTFVGLSADDSEEERTERVERRLERYAIDEGLGELVALLQPVRRPDNVSESLFDLADMHAQQRVLDGVVQLVRQRIGEVKPVYVLEDLQHADSLTLQLAHHLAAMSRDGSFLFVATYRPEQRLESLRQQVDEELELELLNRAQSTELVRRELGAHAVDPALDDFLWRRARGNPALLTEIVRFLADRMLLNLQGGTAAAAEPGLALLEDIVPESWEHVALARLEGLGELERSVLRTAAAIGRYFQGETLREVSDPETWEATATAVESLEAQQLITVDWLDREVYRFRDEVVRATAYSLIPEDERRGIHRRIADALERHMEQGLPGMETVLAHHRERAGQWFEAADWYARAAERNARSGLDRETLHCVERWHVAVDRLPPDRRPPKEKRARVELMRLIATVRQGKPREIVRQVDRLTAEHLERLPRRQRFMLALHLAAAEAAQGQLGQARARLEALHGEPSLRGPMRSDAAYLLGLFRFMALDRDSGLRWVESGLELAHADPLRRILLRLLQSRMLLYAGELEPSLTIIERQRERAQEQGRQHMIAAAEREMGHHALMAGDLERGLHHLRFALTLDRRLASWLWQAEDRRLLGLLHLSARRPEEAHGHLEQAMMIAQEIGHELTRVAALGHLGAVVATTSDPDAGLDMCQQAHRRASELGLKVVQVSTSLHLLALSVDRQQHDLARQALSWCTQLAPVILTPLQRQQLDRLLGPARVLAGTL